MSFRQTKERKSFGNGLTTGLKSYSMLHLLIHFFKYGISGYSNRIFDRNKNTIIFHEIRHCWRNWHSLLEGFKTKTLWFYLAGNWNWFTTSRDDTLPTTMLLNDALLLRFYYAARWSEEETQNLSLFASLLTAMTQWTKEEDEIRAGILWPVHLCM